MCPKETKKEVDNTVESSESSSDSSNTHSYSGYSNSDTNTSSESDEDSNTKSSVSTTTTDLVEGKNCIKIKPVDEHPYVIYILTSVDVSKIKVDVNRTGKTGLSISVDYKQ